MGNASGREGGIEALFRSFLSSSVRPSVLAVCTTWNDRSERARNNHSFFVGGTYARRILRAPCRRRGRSVGRSKGQRRRRRRHVHQIRCCARHKLEEGERERLWAKKERRPGHSRAGVKTGAYTKQDESATQPDGKEVQLNHRASQSERFGDAEVI